MFLLKSNRYLSFFFHCVKLNKVAFFFHFLISLFCGLLLFLQGLFLGSVGAANNKDALKNLNVTHVLTVATSLSPPHPNDFVYKIISGMSIALNELSAVYLDRV